MEVLVLSKTWVPIKTISVLTAVGKVFSGKAKFMSEDYSLHTFDQWIEYSKNNPSNEIINCPNFFINKPVVIVQTTEYARYTAPKPSRKNIFLRDCFTCQYCGKKFSRDDLTIDHVIPKAKGGKTTWTNSVTSCSKCNNKKSDKSIENSGMSLLRKPFQPTYASLFINNVKQEKWKNRIMNIGG